MIPSARQAARTRPHPSGAAFPPAWFLSQERFLRALALERKRVERSHNCFVLMLLSSEELAPGAAIAERVLESLHASTRATDIKGWYQTASIIGVVFTDVGWKAGRSAVNALSRQVRSALKSRLTAAEFESVRVTFHFYPEEWEGGGGDGESVDHYLYPDIAAEESSRRIARAVKRAIDVAGSLSALIVLSPLLGVIAAAVKLTSEGPAIFRQTRVGQFGREFTFLKFRSMRCDIDHSIHESYVKSFIAGNKDGGPSSDGQAATYKLTNDPRITRIGRFLRRSSLDELPQFWNVLRGEMSLVGPRPPVPYEFRAYDLWHRRRLLSVKPGITGLWQVEGRSKVTFDDMVRLDLAYAESWSPWLDLKILFRTPRAVLSGTGAY